jgi:hypothetical protein
MNIFLIILFFPSLSLACSKEIRVDIIYRKVFPSVLDWSHKEYVKKNQSIKIDCKLYNEIEIGDILEPSDKDDLDFNLRDSFFNSPIEEVKYKVLKK